jgi:DNA-binding PadR family transcriptional regulator
MHGKGPKGPPGSQYEERRQERERRREARRDFWRAWRDEQHRRWEEEAGESGETEFMGDPGSPRRAGIWRQFFHDFMGAWPEDHWAFSGRRFSPWQQGLDSFNPLVANLLSMGGGLLPLYVLQLLHQQPRYGNEIMDLINQRTRGGWVANPGAIYPLMNLLEERGLVTGEWDDPRKRTVRNYRLTEVGEKETDRLKAVLRPKLQEAIEVLQELEHELNGSEDEPQII